ncbi:MAG: glycoside hydrolase family 3 domain protein [Thermoleophilia bacterium]|nr:glycoside hydrolase family 3 domain protein [Thermoleophilia bacterium]
MHHRSLELSARMALRATVVAAAIVLALVPAGVVAAGEPAPDPHLLAAQDALRELSLVDRAGQVLMTSVPGATLSARDQASLRQLRPGGIILFGDNYRSRAQLTRLTRSMQVATRAGDDARASAIVSIDQEGGVVRRLGDAPPTRSHPQLGAADDVAATRQQGLRTGAALRAVGVHMDLAPVADLDLRPRRVMRARSFGSDPTLVSLHVRAFVDGLQAGGVSGSVKHFPGFGGASVNSDDALATITRTRAQLDLDLQPFRAAIDAGVESVMVSHGVYVRIDRRRPASTSPAIYRLLRDELGYDGIAITDSLHAAGFGAATSGGVVDGCERVLEAGADIALVTGTVQEAIACRARLVEAVRAGRLSRARLDQAATRVLRLKSKLGLLGAG